MLRLRSVIFGHICTPLINGILLDLNQMWTVVDIFSGKALIRLLIFQAGPQNPSVLNLIIQT